jgi:hypothetical protein
MEMYIKEYSTILLYKMLRNKRASAKVWLSLLIVLVILMSLFIIWQFSSSSVQSGSKSTGNVINNDEGIITEEKSIPTRMIIKDKYFHTDDGWLESKLSFHNFDCNTNGMDIVCSGKSDYIAERGITDWTNIWFSINIFDADNGCLLYSENEERRIYVPKGEFTLTASLEENARIRVDVYYHQGLKMNYDNWC